MEEDAHSRLVVLGNRRHCPEQRRHDGCGAHALADQRHGSRQLEGPYPAQLSRVALPHCCKVGHLGGSGSVHQPGQVATTLEPVAAPSLSPG